MDRTHSFLSDLGLKQWLGLGINLFTVHSLIHSSNISVQKAYFVLKGLLQFPSRGSGQLRQMWSLPPQAHSPVGCPSSNLNGLCEFNTSHPLSEPWCFCPQDYWIDPNSPGTSQPCGLSPTLSVSVSSSTTTGLLNQGYELRLVAIVFSSLVVRNHLSCHYPFPSAASGGPMAKGQAHLWSLSLRRQLRGRNAVFGQTNQTADTCL